MSYTVSYTTMITVSINSPVEIYVVAIAVDDVSPTSIEVEILDRFVRRQPWENLKHRMIRGENRKVRLKEIGCSYRIVSRKILSRRSRFEREKLIEAILTSGQDTQRLK